MTEALMLMQFLTAAANAGANLYAVFGRVSAMIAARHAKGETFTKEDLESLLDEGDEKEAAARKQFRDTMADPNTPRYES